MIPEFPDFILPVLTIFADGRPRTLEEIRAASIAHFGFTQRELEETTKSGHKSKVIDRTEWSLTYLRQARLLDSIRRGVYVITDEGIKLLKNPPERISREYLYSNYSTFRDFMNRSKSSRKGNYDADSNSSTFQSTTANKEISTVQQLISMRQAIETFRQVGIPPSSDQLTKLASLEATVLERELYPKVANLFSSESTMGMSDFVLAVKCQQDEVTFKYVGNSDVFDSIPGESVSIKVGKKAIGGTHPRKRRPNLNFYDLGLIEGDTIKFTDDESVTATIVNEDKVEYNGSQYSLTKLTQELKNLPHPIQPTGKWTFEGQTLLTLYNDLHK